MGLDGVEIVMEVEERFGVTIADEEAGEVRTVGDLVRLLEDRVARRGTTRCLSLPWFLKLRTATRRAADDQRLRVRPSLAIKEVLKPRQRRALWRSLPGIIGTAPHHLNRPAEVNTMIVASVLLAALGAIFCWQADPMLGMLAWLGVFAVPIALHLATLPLHVCPPPGWQTFGEVTQRLVGLEAVREGFPLKSSELILAEVREIVVNQLGVDPDEVTLEARFVEDLNMD